jgi:tRNA pseudouridine32 synthase / 23S rRNA pseudouridine746 synthase
VHRSECRTGFQTDLREERGALTPTLRTRPGSCPGRPAILLDDGRLLAVDKPEGIPCIPDRRGTPGHLRQVLEEETGRRLLVVHRLDTDTSGLVVFAQDPDMHRWLSIQFQEHKVVKEYTALAAGSPEPPEGIIDRPLRRFGSGRTAVDPSSGKPAATVYRLMESIGRWSLLSLHPLTGRTHQIRAHLYSIGHPVAGDFMYGDRAFQSGFPRLMLHATRLEIPMPDGSVTRLHSPPGGSFESVLEACRKGASLDGREP